MAVPAFMTAIGLTVALTLVGQTDPSGIQYTIRVHNTGTQDLEQTQVVQFAPRATTHLSAGANAGPEGERVVRRQPMEAGVRATLVSTAEVTGRPEGSSHIPVTVCVHPDRGATAQACASVAHRPSGPGPRSAVVAGLLLLAAVVGVAGIVRSRACRRPRPEPPTPSNHTPGSVPNVRTFPGSAKGRRPTPEGRPAGRA